MQHLTNIRDLLRVAQSLAPTGGYAGFVHQQLGQLITRLDEIEADEMAEEQPDLTEDPVEDDDAPQYSCYGCGTSIRHSGSCGELACDEAYFGTEDPVDDEPTGECFCGRDCYDGNTYCSQGCADDEKDVLEYWQSEEQADDHYRQQAELQYELEQQVER